MIFGSLNSSSIRNRRLCVYILDREGKVIALLAKLSCPINLGKSPSLVGLACL